MQPCNLYVDVNNLAFITRFSRVQTPRSRTRKDPFAKDLIFVEMLRAIVSQAMRNMCTGVVLAMESRRVWRKDIYKLYKAKDVEDEDIYYQETLDACEMLYDFICKHTAAMALRVDRTEGDDIIGVLISNSSGVKNVILSSDTDYTQLLDENTKLYSLPQKKYRESEDPAYDLFLKCMRGDRSDAVESAFKGIRETKLKKAWTDKVDMLNLLNTKRPDNRTVEEVLSLNYQLIDLTMQPDWVKENIIAARDSFVSGKFNQFGISRILKEEYRLHNFSGLFDGCERPFIQKPKFVV